MTTPRHGNCPAAVLAALALLTGCSGSSSGPAEPGVVPPPTGFTTDQVIDVAGTTRWFDYYVPAGFGPGAALVVLLHGGTGNRVNVVDGTSGSSGWLLAADQGGFLLLLPNGADAAGDTNAVSANWNDCRGDETAGSTADDVAFLRALIDWALANPAFDLDPSRVYVAGASNGGMMSYRAALELDDRVAAVAAFIANNPAVPDPDCAAAIARVDYRPVPVFIANGTLDALMPFAGGDIAFGGRGTVESSAATRDFWRSRNGTAVAEPPVSFPDADPTDGSTVSAVRYTGGVDGAEVAYYVVAGGGHSMPSRTYFSGGNQNRDLEIALEAWAFLDAHRR